MVCQEPFTDLVSIHGQQQAEIVITVRGPTDTQVRIDVDRQSIELHMVVGSDVGSVMRRAQATNARTLAVRAGRCLQL